MSVAERAALAALLLIAGPAGAQGFGGSFDTPPPATQAPAQQAPAGTGNFEGSFGTQNAPPPDLASPAPPSAQPPVTPPQASVPEPAPPRLPPEIDPGIAAFEFHDFGVSPTSELRQRELHAPTPIEVPNAVTIGTQALVDAALEGIETLGIDVLGAGYTLPGAFVMPHFANPGHFRDGIQQQVSLWLTKMTEGDTSYPIIVFCSDPMCWRSYNAALRILAAGYDNVYWYRGGLQAWEMAGLPLEPAGS